MKILFLSPRLPLPADTGGKIRTLNILKQAACRHQVHLLCFSFESTDRDYIKDLEKLGISVTLVPIQEPHQLLKAAGVLLKSMPFAIAKYDLPAMHEAVVKILQEQSFDLMHVDHLHMAHYRIYFKNSPCVLDEHNVEYKILERCAGVAASILKKAIYQQQAAKMKTFEAAKINEFQAVTACSIDDQQLLKNMGQAAVHVLANGVDTEYFKAKASNSEESMVFTGSMDWLPNDDAITYFCDKILPLIWEKNAKVKLYVVGKSPSAAVKDLAKREDRVIVTGRVDDVRPYIQRSKVFIVPLRIGGGTRLKILEAMAASKAVVSTSIGAEGIEYTNNQNILLGDSPKDFANQVLFLLANHDKCQALGAQARQLVCRQYDWNSIGQQLETIYGRLVHAQKA